MKLKDFDNQQQLWTDKGYIISDYDRNEIINNTNKNPKWIHFGAGNLFRAYPAVFQDKLIEKGLSDTGIIAVGGRNSKNITDYFQPFNNLHIAITLQSDGNVEKRVVKSICDSLVMEQMDELKNIFSKESLQVASFTITEKGYRVSDSEEDLTKSYEKATSYIGRLASLLVHRYQNGSYPMTFVSMDNCSHNGDVLKAAINKFVDAWNIDGFKNYIDNKISFTISMIDKITPRPDKTVMEILEKDGVEDLTDPNYYMNCFCNAESTEYLVIEDNFKNGRPNWDCENVIFTDRETVDKVEKMKVCTCLNPAHTALAIFGCLLGYKLIWKEMKDETLVKLVNHIGYDEGLPVVVDPEILNPKEFLDTVLQVRVTNPFMPDAPQRIAMDTSQKIPVRYGETLKAYLAKGFDLTQLTFLPLTFAGWLRYLTGINDEGEKFELSSDPLLSELCPIMNYQLNNQVSVEDIKEILSNKKIFAIDLIECGLADKVVGYLNEMLQGKGAVRKTLEKYV